ncbi:hypothetical protein F4801DRAFT_165090 [Xylaria longipes]|nr:hypothetical protein F4801DRAFT_165090 [Xylaria longipes]RYC53808.1 hypothetical protein CHU98_g12400 [Xylaria longipes]
MDRYLGQLWTPSVAKPEGKKLKRKLQKLGAQQEQQQRPYSVNYSDTKMSPEYKSRRTSLSFSLFSSMKPSAPQRPSLPPPTNTEDGKWLEDFRKSGYLYRDSRRSRQPENEQTRERPVTVMVPEFAHLAVSTTPPPEKTPSPPIRNGPHQPTRRYAKTPVSHIGQLETHPLLRTQGVSQDVPTIESIAESYRALLESRASFLSDANIEHAATVENHNDFFSPQDPALVPPPLEPVAEVPEPPIPRGSPRSDDGTLVEEDSADFKHVTISSIPSTPSWASYETAPLALERKATTPSRGPDLQTCLYLLTNELSSAMNGSPAQPSTDTSALQIWVMIEAYEKLRDQVLRTHEGDIQESPLRATFDTWLKALHSIHDGMTGGDGQRSESDYGD